MPCSQSNSCHTTPHQQIQSACAAIREVALRHVDGLELANGPDYAYLLSASSSLITHLLALSSQNRVVRARTSSGRARRSSHSQIQLPKICDFCGKTDSPNWRGGPNGKGTLCNACGLRWSRRHKKPTHTSQCPNKIH